MPKIPNYRMISIGLYADNNGTHDQLCDDSVADVVIQEVWVVYVKNCY